MHKKRTGFPQETGSFYYLLFGDGFDLAQDTLGQRLDSHAAAGGLGGEVAGIHLVEGGKVAHISQEAGGLALRR